MTWTVFEFQTGDNETDDDAPGRGGYSTVLVHAPEEEAVSWWEEYYDADPTRMVPYAGHDPNATVWETTEVEDEKGAQAACGEMELDQGGIGVPMKRLYTWDEIHGRLDVKVVDEP